MTKTVRRNKEPKRNGRPPIYTEKLSNEICESLACGKSLTQICRKDNMPCYSTVMKWLRKESPYQKDFLERYEIARKMQADYYADEIVEIADDSKENIRRSRLRIGARKWIACRLRPKKYGDSTSLKLTDGGPATFRVVYEEKNPIQEDDELKE